MSFNPPLEEIHNITLYFYRQLIIRVPFISVCISRSPDHTPCDKIEFVESTELHSTMEVWLMKLLTNATSVTYLRIDMQYDRYDDDVFIFLSEIRIQPMYTETVITSTMDNNTNMPSSDNDDDSVSVAVISGAVAGTLLLIIIIIIIIVIVVTVFCSRRRKKSRIEHNIEAKDFKMPSNVPDISPQQNTTGNSPAVLSDVQTHEIIQHPVCDELRMESSQVLSFQVKKAPDPVYHEFSPYGKGLAEIPVAINGQSIVTSDQVKTRADLAHYDSERATVLLLN